MTSPNSPADDTTPSTPSLGPIDPPQSPVPPHARALKAVSCLAWLVALWALVFFLPWAAMVSLIEGLGFWLTWTSFLVGASLIACVACMANKGVFEGSAHNWTNRVFTLCALAVVAWVLLGAVGLTARLAVSNSTFWFGSTPMSASGFRSDNAQLRAGGRVYLDAPNVCRARIDGYNDIPASDRVGLLFVNDVPATQAVCDRWINTLEMRPR